MDIRREDDDLYEDLLRYEMTQQRPTYECYACKERFEEPDTLESCENYEYWGERGLRRTYLEVCPTCGNEAIGEIVYDEDE